MKKKVCIVTGSRAEYGLLYPIIRGFLGILEIETIVIVTGSHLSAEFGMTVKEIEANGIPISERIEILLSSDSPVAAGKAMGLALIGISEALSRHKPDIIILLGDRFEIFCAAAAATVAHVPIAHIHGGELTFGAIDDAFRHSITKMSNLHFVSTDEYRKRVISMGEHPQSVFDVGSLGVEAAVSLKLMSKEELEQSLGIKLGRETFLVTFHPATLESESAETQVGRLLDALDCFPSATCIITMANADMEGRAINAVLERFAIERKARIHVFSSLGQMRYLSLMQYSKLVIGNSSSGIIEAPSFGIPTINIGSRQQGRIKADSVIDCGVDTTAIVDAIKTGLSSEFAVRAKKVNNPYMKSGTTKMIIEKIYQSLMSGFIEKRFYEGPAGKEV